MSYVEYTVKVFDDGTKHWNQNDKLHREDGPAIETVSSSKYWYLNGKRHRVDGPAIEYANGTKRWFLYGKEYAQAEFLKKTAPVKEYTVAELEAILGHSVKIVKDKA